MRRHALLEGPDVPAATTPGPSATSSSSDGAATTRRRRPPGASARRRRAEWPVDAIVLSALGVVALWRWWSLAAIPGPIGVDSGNWLRLAQAMLGRVEIQDVVVPPLVPILAGLLDLVLGPLHASRMLTVLASVAPALGVWWVLRHRPRPVMTVTAVLAVALVPPTAAAFAWGGVPQLIGLGLLPVGLWTIAVATSAQDRRAWFRAGTVAALVGLTSTLVSVLLAAGALTLLLVALLRRGTVALTGVSAALAPLAPVAVLYAVILPRMSLPEGRTTAATGLRALEHGLGAPLWLWLGLLGLLAAGSLAAVATRDVDDMALLLVGGLGVAVAGVLLGDVRFIAGIPTAVALAVVLVGERSAAAAPVRIVAGVALVALMATGVETQARQLGFYAQFAPRTILEDVERIAQVVPRGERVAVPPVAGAPTGWWLEARGIDAAVASRSDWLSFPGERAAAAQALALFSAPDWPVPTVAEASCAIAAPWLYVPDAWGGMDGSALSREIAAGRLRLATRLPGGVLLRSEAC
jgi:hypothetical protein